MFFKGYVETKDKKCIEKFKNRTDFKTYEQVKSLPEFAGILDEETILVDIDDFEQSEVLMNIVEDFQLNCRVYATTRGKHFLFKNAGVEKCFTHCKLAIGLTADIKVGVKNSYEILKFDGKEREIIYDIYEEDGDEYQEIPKFMKPVKGKAEFLDMDAGDGRNQALFNYILTLQSADFEKEEARDVLRMVNQYVLKEPLSEDELNVIMRDDAFSKPVFYKGATFLHDKFGNYIINNHHIIKLNKQLHVYVDGIYTSSPECISNIMRMYIPGLKKGQKAEVLDYIMDVAAERKVSDARFIAFRNGVLDVETGVLHPHSPDYVILNKIPWDFNPYADDVLTNETLNKISCNDPEIRFLLEECIGYCFYRMNIMQKAFILTGSKSNGKSTFISMLNSILGDENIAAADLKNLNDRFTKATIFKKLANIGDDISDDFIQDTSLFKKIVSGDRIQAEFKGATPFEFNPYAKLIFSANSIPRMKDKTGAVIRRLVIIPFNANFSKDDPDYDPDIKRKLTSQQAMEYCIRIGVEGLQRLLKNKGFSNSSKVQKELDEYEEQNNPVLAFFKDVDDEDYIFRETTKEIYLAYSHYCQENGYMAESANQFGRTLKALFRVESKQKTVNGKSVRIYVKIAE